MELARAFAERYHFLKFPQLYEDFNNEETGLLFADGSFEGFEVSELRLFPNGLLINTGGSTDVGERLFADSFAVWEAIGLPIARDMVTQSAYVSQLAVKSEIDLLLLNRQIADMLEHWFPSGRTDGWRGPAGVGTVGMFTQGNLEVAPPLRIERLAGAPLDALEFWAQAPLQTTLHLSFLQQWETVLKETVQAISSTEREQQT